ncbi:MAG: zinc-finger domain-containing protein [Gammaproteobacteria bacterium]|nr:zinc-finger domain-containing protein [Gammaproteobacteria bacterium]
MPGQRREEHETPIDARGYFRVSRAELPLHCPPPGTSLWNSHPRVFLPIEESGEAVCPYCGARYVLDGNR